MPLNIKILQEKLEIEKNQEKIVDLTSQSMNYIGNYNFSEKYIVEFNHIMRPDILSLDTGQRGDFIELLKSNSISNPFTLDTDDVIFIPNNFTSLIVTPKSTSDDSDADVRNSYVNPDKAATPDSNIKKLSNKFNFLKDLSKDTLAPSPSNLPPNFNEFGQGEVEVINNKVRFAPGVGRNASECSTEPISKAELISQVLKNKLNS